MTQYRSKLHPSSCFPPNPPPLNTRNHLFIRISSNQTQYTSPRLTFIGINETTYSTIAALLAYRPTSLSIESIKLFDICPKFQSRTILNDLQLIGLFNKVNIHLECVHSYLETKDSNIIIVNVQHNQLENESISTWIQMNALLVENIVSQVCIYSPHAILIICTQPNELMTYVAAYVSKFPSERIIGLGASVDTAYGHKTILDQMKNVRGHINGFFVIGNGIINDSCTTVLTNNLTINGIYCSDIYSKSRINQINDSERISQERKLKHWDVLKTLENNENVYSNLSRRLPIISNVNSRQKTVIKYLLSNFIPDTKSKQQQQPSSITIPCNIKLRSNWTEAMLIVRIIQALINGKQFQSNFAVNITPITNSKDVFINYPTIIGSTNGAIEYMLPFHQAENLLKQDSFIIPYEKFQRKLCLLKSKD